MVQRIKVFRSWRRCVLLAADAAGVALALYAAYATRFWQLTLPGPFLALYFRTLPAAILIVFFSYLFFNLYHGIWRFAGLQDLLALTRAVAWGTAAFIILSFFHRDFRAVPRPVFFLFALYLFFITGFLRVFTRLYREYLETRKTENGRRARSVLILGAGETGEIVARNLSGCRGRVPAGFIDDDPEKQGALIHGVKVLGTSGNLAAVLAGQPVEELIVAIHRFPPDRMRLLLETCNRAGVRVLTVPRMSDILAGRVQTDRLRPVGMEDLLNRRPADFDKTRVRDIIAGRRVLVTGAAGSIGSELCRQVISWEPASLCLLEWNETGLFRISNELSEAGNGLARPVVGDICDRPAMARLFAAWRPEIVFHAAAYKHVPLMEENPSEAVRNNITGTRILADLALEHRVGRFVMLSTDKAVNPAGVMGMTKRLAELYLQSRPPGDTCFRAVRFGNVLDSAGSVVQTFREQIERGGPVTVTDREIERYFMTIPEAVELILFAVAGRCESAVLVLEMGDLVRISDLARQLITLAGLTPGRDIEIVYTGLRPGEKLYEELYHQREETLLETDSPLIKGVRPKNPPDPGTIERALADLDAALGEPPERLRERLRQALDGLSAA